MGADYNPKVRLKIKFILQLDWVGTWVSKGVHVIQIRHRDEVETPLTDWLKEAYELSDVLASKPDTSRPKLKQKQKKAKAVRKATRMSN